MLKIISLKWTIYEDFKDWICTLAEQMWTLKTNEMSQMNPKKFLHHNTTLPVTPFKGTVSVISSGPSCKDSNA